MPGGFGQPFRTRDLPEDVDGRRIRVESADGLQGVRPLVGRVHARAGLDEAQIPDGAVPHLPLKQVPSRMEVKLVIDGDLDAGRPGKSLDRQEILALDGQGFFDQHGRYARRLRRLEDLQAYRGRRVHVDQVGFLPFEHLAVVRVPGGYVEGRSEGL